MSDELVLVAIASPSPVLRQGVAARFAKDRGLRVLTATASPRRLLRVAKRHIPDVIVVDEHLTALTGHDVVAELQRVAETSAVVVLLMTGQASGVANAFSAGAAATVSRSATLETLVRAVHEVAVGDDIGERPMYDGNGDDGLQSSALLVDCAEWVAVDDSSIRRRRGSTRR